MVAQAGWQWSLTLTPGAKNTITTVEAKDSTKTLSKTKNSDNNKVKIGAADISQIIDINQEGPEGYPKITNL